MPIEGKPGKRRNATTYLIEFADEPGVAEALRGLVFEARSATIDQLYLLVNMGNVDITNLTTDGFAMMEKLSDSFPERLVAWNYQDEAGRDLPPTKEVFADEDWNVTLPMIQKWLEVVTQDPEAQRRLAKLREDIKSAKAAEELSDEEPSEDEAALAQLAMNPAS